MFFSTLALPSAQARRAKVRSIGYGTLGWVDDDDPDKQRTDRRPGLLNSAPTFDFRQRPINAPSLCWEGRHAGIRLSP